MHFGGIFCDFAKASGCLNHKIMLDILYLYGTGGVNAYWFRSFLRNRKRKFEIKSPYSITDKHQHMHFFTFNTVLV